MLNTRGGQVIFGVTKDGAVVGQETTDQTVEKVASEVKRIDPPGSFEIERIRLDGTSREAIVVTVSRSHRRPHSFKHVGYKRVGNTTSELARDEYNQLVF